MRDRITQKHLDGLCAIINRMTDSPGEPYTRGDDGSWNANVGNYHISGAYGGVNLCRMSNESGGVSNTFSCGHIPKRDLYERMRAMIHGLETAREGIVKA